MYTKNIQGLGEEISVSFVISNHFQDFWVWILPNLHILAILCKLGKLRTLKSWKWLEITP
jgi:hypothetical protein